MTRAAIYARVSQDPSGQARSVAEQEAECRRFCDAQGWTTVELFTDNDKSASRYATKARPEYARLRDFVKSGSCDVLVTWEASRFQRDLEAYAALARISREAGVLWSYSGRTYDLNRPDDAFSTGLDALLGARESDVTRERVLRSVRANAATGRPHGRVLFGYQRIYDLTSGELVEQTPREDQAAVVREAARRVHSGETPYAVALDFNRRGIPTPHGGGGGRWDLSSVKRMVLNPGYAGHRVHRGKIVGPASWPAILDEAIWSALVERLNDPKRRTNRDSAVKHLLTGLALCGVCDEPVRKQKNRGFDAYVCGSGFHVSRRQDHVDELVTGQVLDRLADPNAGSLLAGAPADDGARSAEAEAIELQSRLDGFYDLGAEGKLTPAALARIEGRLLPQIETAKRRARPRRGVPASVTETAGPGAADRWLALSVPQRREIIAYLVSVRILPTKRGQRTFDPDQVEIRAR